MALPIEDPLCLYCRLPVSIADGMDYAAVRVNGEYGYAHVPCQETQDARERQAYVAYKSINRKGGEPHVH